MNSSETKDLVVKFNSSINRQDVHALEELVTNDHAFVDSAGNRVEGKEKVLASWKDFFTQFPDYKNIFENFTTTEEGMVVIGYSTCSFAPLDGRALWSAKAEDGKLSEWRVYDDTKANRKLLNIE